MGKLIEVPEIVFTLMDLIDNLDPEYVRPCHIKDLQLFNKRLRKKLIKGEQNEKFENEYKG